MGANETVVVTGASAGIGRAIARRFARPGVSLGLIGRNQTALEAARREVEQSGAKALVLPADVADFAAVESAACTVEEAFGPIDVWVNNAMTTVFAFFDDIEPDEYRRATEVTYLGTVWGTQTALRRMLSRDSGAIVQVGSALAYRGIPLQSPYCGSKHAIKGFTESVRTELLHDGSDVHVTMVQLPALNTPQFDMGRTKMDRQPQPVPPIYQPEVAADAIVWASEQRRREVFVGASTVKTIWGNKLLPGVADRYLARNGFAAQLTDEKLEGGRQGNLFAPVPGDHGTRGRFDDARRRSVQLVLSQHRSAIGGALALAALGAVAEIARRRP